MVELSNRYGAVFIRKIAIRRLNKNRLSDDGRVYFTMENAFSASFSLTGPKALDNWYIIDLEFLHGITGRSQELVRGGTSVFHLVCHFWWMFRKSNAYHYFHMLYDR